MADPAAEGATDAASYPAFVRTANDIDTRVSLLIAQIASETHNERKRA